MKTMRLMTILLLGFVFLFSGISSPLMAQEPIMPISQVEKGMKGYGLSDFGDGVDRFEVEIYGFRTVEGEKNPIVHVSGGPDNIVDRTGVSSGMSGSPVYLYDDSGEALLVGAISFNWKFGKGNMGGITPIEAMRAEMDDSSMLGGGKTSVPSKAMSAFSPIPLLGMPSGGLSPDNLADPAFLAENSARIYPRPESRPEMKLVPGSAVAIHVLSGDYILPITGTVTEVFPDGRFSAFGHPFLDLGSVSMPASRLPISMVYPSLTTSFKLAGSEWIGQPATVDFDGQFGIYGRIGVQPDTIPLDLKIKGASFERQVSLQVPDDEILTFSGSFLGMYSFLSQNSWIPRDSAVALDATLSYSKGDELRIRETHSTLTSPGSIPGIVFMNSSLGPAIGKTYNLVGENPISILLDFTVHEEARVIRLEDVDFKRPPLSALERHFEPGEKLTFRPGDSVSPMVELFERLDGAEEGVHRELKLPVFLVSEDAGSGTGIVYIEPASQFVDRRPGNTGGFRDREDFFRKMNMKFNSPGNVLRATMEVPEDFRELDFAEDPLDTPEVQSGSWHSMEGSLDSEEFSDPPDRRIVSVLEYVAPPNVLFVAEKEVKRGFDLDAEFAGATVIAMTVTPPDLARTGEIYAPGDTFLFEPGDTAKVNLLVLGHGDLEGARPYQMITIEIPIPEDSEDGMASVWLEDCFETLQRTYALPSRNAEELRRRIESGLVAINNSQKCLVAEFPSREATPSLEFDAEEALWNQAGRMPRIWAKTINAPGSMLSAKVEKINFMVSGSPSEIVLTDIEISPKDAIPGGELYVSITGARRARFADDGKREFFRINLPPFRVSPEAKPGTDAEVFVASCKTAYSLRLTEKARLGMRTLDELRENILTEVSGNALCAELTVEKDLEEEIFQEQMNALGVPLGPGMHSSIAMAPVKIEPGVDEITTSLEVDIGSGVTVLDGSNSFFRKIIRVVVPKEPESKDIKRPASEYIPEW